MRMRWRRWLPYLDFYLDLGLLRLKTDLFSSQEYDHTFTYVRLHVEILRRHLFTVRLYKRYD